MGGGGLDQGGGQEGGAPKSTTLPARAVPAAKLTREALERHLWATADILRGSIDSSDYKNYILGLLFLKRLSDRFEEECEALRAAGHDPEERDAHQFYVPLRARWAELRKVTTDVGQALNKAAEALEEDNDSLEGVLAGIDFNNEHRLGDTRQRDSILLQLLQHYSLIDLRNASLFAPDMLGGAYEYLIERFADDAGKKGGEFRTPHQVGKLMVELLRPEEGMRICDPTCGSGGLLIQCAEYVARHGGDPRNLSLYGQEKNLGTWAICKMNMLLHGRLDDYIAKGDLAFVQHMISILSGQGRMAVVMPIGVLFRGGVERDIRRRLIESDLVESIIQLPAGPPRRGTGIQPGISMPGSAHNKHS